MIPAEGRFLLDADRRLRSIDHGRLLVGGRPFRLLRLRPEGAALVRRWFAGEPIALDAAAGATAEDAVAARLARRLLTAGIAHPRPLRPAASLVGGSVIVPVKDDDAGLLRTLAALHDAVPVVVVDDGSTPPVDRRRLPGRVTLIRAPHNGGPAAARNLGWTACGDAIWVAFVDAGVELTPDALRELVASFADPTVVGVAPRVRSRADRGWVAAYERHHSPLDLGTEPSAVGPGRAVGHVPTAALVVASDRLQPDERTPPFDPDLRYGEDVDLIWRVTARGGVIRYRPDVEVTHPPRATLAAFWRQRVGYGSAAAPLAERHGSALAHVGWSPDTAIAALGVAVATGLRTITPISLGAALVSAALVRTHRRLRPIVHDTPAPDMEAARLTAAVHGAATRNLTEASVRAWWPLTVVGAGLVPPLRIPLALAVTAGALRRGRRPGTIALGLVDDVAYGTGVWLGARRSRSLRAVRPVRFGS